MASVGLLVLLDDIATILDDVAAMSKIAARKTAGVLGDDLALNAEQVSGVAAERELPVVYKVAMGSLRNKAILVPAALLISWLAPWLITPLLMCGGLYLCFEGFEKVFHHETKKPMERAAENNIALEDYEKKKVQGAIRTDFVLSAEIIVISLGIVASTSLMTQFLTLSVIALLMTICVYGLVAGIVKIDDLGLYLQKNTLTNLWGTMSRKIGHSLLVFAPYLMKGLTIVGTIAMFLVGGGIICHGIHFLSAHIQLFSAQAANVLPLSTVMTILVSSSLQALVGIIAGGLAVSTVTLFSKLPFISSK